MIFQIVKELEAKNCFLYADKCRNCDELSKFAQVKHSWYDCFCKIQVIEWKRNADGWTYILRSYQSYIVEWSMKTIMVSCGGDFALWGAPQNEPCSNEWKLALWSWTYFIKKVGGRGGGDSLRCKFSKDVQFLRVQVWIDYGMHPL